MEYSNIEKAAIVLYLLGQDFISSILMKIPKELVVVVQEKVLPKIEDVKLPQNIDEFVLQEIINKNKQLSTKLNSGELIDQKNKEMVNDNQKLNDKNQKILDPSETKPLINISEISEEDLLKEVPVEIVVELLKKESAVFYELIKGLFAKERQKQIDGFFGALPRRTKQGAKTEMFNTFEQEFRTKFIKKLRSTWDEKFQNV